MEVERTAQSEEWKRAIAENLAVGRTLADWERGRERFTLRKRWQLFRRRRRWTWRDWREDLRYLFRG